MGSEEKKRRGLLGKALLFVVSLGLSLTAAELGFRFVRDSAFPFLNIYRQDPVFGVALDPSADATLRSRLGRLSHLRTNRLGFRGDEWEKARDNPVRGRVLLLGDSQMLGYGVDEKEATAARMEQQTGGAIQVLNAAVPTWGPVEYVEATKRLVPTYRPEIVLFVANAANDWYETKVPNTLRSDARDGWLIRGRRDRTPVQQFPGRRFLLGRSHMVYGVRAILASRRLADRPPATAAQRLAKDVSWLSNSGGDHRSRITPALEKAAEICAAYDCRIVAVALPMDVQVDDGEWAKYRSARPIDLTASRSLITDFIQDAAELGIPALDLTSPLQMASPGMFLEDDYHLSSQGHSVVAQSIIRIIADSSGGSS